MPALPNALAAAHRARTIAAIARTRATSTTVVLDDTGRAALTQIAELLDTAAHSLETEEPSTVDGIVITNTMDWDASYALITACHIAAANPAIGFPPHFTQYVTAPVFGNDIELPPSLLPGGPVLIAQEGDLFARLLALHGHYLAITVPQEDPESITAALEAAFTLHWKHARLAEAVAVDAARPCKQPTVEPAPLDLTGLTPYTVGVIRLAESKGLHPTWAGPGYRNVTRRISLNAGGQHGTFGTIHIGRRSGKVLRIELIHGNDGTPTRAEGAKAARALLKAAHVHACPDDCTAPSTATCRP
ncbi:hypothetical protein ACFY1J_05485 [Streptomyces sp. NPDC001406]|uniref:hypothetical protein n=1 Tax=Streptomyces sp. NPDC001406 TaxID=3364572 RepID=UPI00368DA7BD